MSESLSAADAEMRPHEVAKSVYLCFAILGGTIGLFVGWSRSPVVGAFLGGLLSVVSGIALLLLSADPAGKKISVHPKQMHTIFIAIALFAVATIAGCFVGIYLRTGRLLYLGEDIRRVTIDDSIAAEQAAKVHLLDVRLEQMGLTLSQRQRYIDKLLQISDVPDAGVVLVSASASPTVPIPAWDSGRERVKLMTTHTEALNAYIDFASREIIIADYYLNQINDLYRLLTEIRTSLELGESPSESYPAKWQQRLESTRWSLVSVDNPFRVKQAGFSASAIEQLLLRHPLPGDPSVGAATDALSRLVQKTIAEIDEMKVEQEQIHRVVQQLQAATLQSLHAISSAAEPELMRRVQFDMVYDLICGKSEPSGDSETPPLPAPAAPAPAPAPAPST